MEDDFDYDEDYSFPDSDDDDEVRQEFELDDIRSDFSSNPEGALVRLRAVAENLNSIHCIEAAFDLFKLAIGPNSFDVLVRAVAFAPVEVDSFERITPLESSWAMMERHFPDSAIDGPLTLALSKAVDVLKSSPQIRVYLKALLCISRSFVKLRALKEALNVLQLDLYPRLEKFEKDSVWAPGLRYQAAVLETQICVSTVPVDFLWLHGCLDAVEASPKGLTFPVEKCVMTEVHARLLVETKRLYEAKSLFEKTMRSYEDTLAIQGSQYPLIRCTVFLVLVSTVIGKGSYDASLEVPLLKSLRGNSAIAAVSAVSKVFMTETGTPTDFSREMEALEVFLANDDWKLASTTILKLVRESLIQLRTVRALALYNRISLDSLVSKVGTIAASGPLIRESTMLTQNKLITWIANGSLDREFRLNVVDGTVDEVRQYKDWGRRSEVDDADLVIPLPKRYLDLKNSRDRKKQESAILDRWKTSSSPNLSKGPTKIVDAEDELSEELKRTLCEHRNTMAM